MQEAKGKSWRLAAVNEARRSARATCRWPGKGEWRGINRSISTRKTFALVPAAPSVCTRGRECFSAAEAGGGGGLLFSLGRRWRFCSATASRAAESPSRTSSPNSNHAPDMSLNSKGNNAPGNAKRCRPSRRAGSAGEWTAGRPPGRQHLGARFPHLGFEPEARPISPNRPTPEEPPEKCRPQRKAIGRHRALGRGPLISRRCARVPQAELYGALPRLVALPVRRKERYLLPRLRRLSRPLLRAQPGRARPTPTP